MGLLTIIKRIFGFASKKGAMGPGDRMLRCIDCSGEFVFDEGEQHFFQLKGFTDPKRCPRCRKKIKHRMKKNRTPPKVNRSHRRSESHNDSPYVDERY